MYGFTYYNMSDESVEDDCVKMKLKTMYICGRSIDVKVRNANKLKSHTNLFVDKQPFDCRSRFPFYVNIVFYRFSTSDYNIFQIGTIDSRFY